MSAKVGAMIVIVTGDVYICPEAKNGVLGAPGFEPESLRKCHACMSEQ
jgi:hypothetical protein